MNIIRMNILDTLLEEKIEYFIKSFKESSRELFYDEEQEKLVHTGEFGRLREIVCKGFIRYSIPLRLDIGTGFVFNHAGDISTQVDLVVFDKNETPLVQDSENQYFYPAETVCAVGEVKSVLNKADLKTALNKLAKVKIIRERISETDTAITRANPARSRNPSEFNPIEIDADRMLSFLICERLDFNLSNITNEINSYYENSIEPRNKHNMILSLEDGLILYNDFRATEDHLKFSPQPVVHTPSMLIQKNLALGIAGEDKLRYIKTFCSLLFSRTNSISILTPDMANYLEQNLTVGYQLQSD